MGKGRGPACCCGGRPHPHPFWQGPWSCSRSCMTAWPSLHKGTQSCALPQMETRALGHCCHLWEVLISSGALSTPWKITKSLPPPASLV